MNSGPASPCSRRVPSSSQRIGKRVGPGVGRSVAQFRACRRLDGNARARVVPIAMGNPHVYDKSKYHLETVEEAGLPEEHASNHIVVILRWLIENDLLDASFAADQRAQLDRYRAGELSIHELFVDWWDGCLVSDMVSDAGNAFAMHYFDYEKGSYLRDYVEVLASSVPSEFHVEYTEANYAKMKQVIDRRYRDWLAGRGRKGSEAAPASARPWARVGLASLIFGSVSMLLGITLLAWISYNLFVEMQPEAKGRNPLMPAVFAVMLVVVGIQRLRVAMKPKPRGEGPQLP